MKEQWDDYCSNSSCGTGWGQGVDGWCTILLWMKTVYFSGFSKLATRLRILRSWEKLCGNKLFHKENVRFWNVVSFPIGRKTQHFSIQLGSVLHCHFLVYLHENFQNEKLILYSWTARKRYDIVKVFPTCFWRPSLGEICPLISTDLYSKAILSKLSKV